MSIQRINAAKRARISRSIGRPVVMAWTHGNDWRQFIAPPVQSTWLSLDHEHGLWNRRTSEVQFLPDAPHVSSCEELMRGYWRALGAHL